MIRLLILFYFQFGPIDVQPSDCTRMRTPTISAHTELAVQRQVISVTTPIIDAVLSVSRSLVCILCRSTDQ
ncbi:hypothetical protein EDB19DRAFT_2048154 [Suillus lakei]|nr:hypothetical protein EDB19DRAFT_2048154 [Suillus lakei]